MPSCWAFPVARSKYRDCLWQTANIARRLLGCALPERDQGKYKAQGFHIMNIYRGSTFHSAVNLADFASTDFMEHREFPLRLTLTTPRGHISCVSVWVSGG